MANILDYVDWRGDIPLSVSPFNEVDSLVFAKFSFIDLGGIIPETAGEGALPLAAAVEQYLKKFPDDERPLGLIVPPQTRPLIRHLAATRRYGDMRLHAFVDHVDENVQKQFAALTVELDEDTLYVVFRGTDDTLVGWKENFNMGFLAAVPAQLDAVDYLNAVAAALPHRHIYVGGHSKGGNLAIYAAMHCHEQVRSRIVQVYSNDGPGYRHEVVISPAYQALEERIVTIIPQSSVVGRLLEHQTPDIVVQSTAQGLWQHDGFSWEVKGTSFVRAAALTQESELIDRSLSKWIDEMSDSEREQVVDAFYRVLTATNAKTLTELTSDRNWIVQLLGSSDAEARKTMLSAVTQLTGEAGRQWIEGLLPGIRAMRKDAEQKAKQKAKEAKDRAKKTAPKPAASERPTVAKQAAEVVGKIDRALDDVITREAEQLIWIRDQVKKKTEPKK